MDVFPPENVIPLECKIKSCFICILWQKLQDQCSFFGSMQAIHANQVNGRDISDTSDKKPYLNMALVYNILAPEGYCGKARPLWYAVEYQEPVETSNAVIDDLVKEIDMLLPIATSSTRIFSAAKERGNNRLSMDYWVPYKKDGTDQCACSVCKEYVRYYEIYRQYKAGELSTETLEQLDLSPIQLEFLGAVDLSP